MKSLRLMALGPVALLAAACGRDPAQNDAARARDLQLAAPGTQTAYATPQELGYPVQYAPGAAQPPAGYYYYPGPQAQPVRTAPVAYRAPAARPARASTAGTTRTATATRKVTHSRRDAAIGAGVGAVTGAIVGRNVKGALIGAGIGGAVGAVVGATVDVDHR